MFSIKSLSLLAASSEGGRLFGVMMLAFVAVMVVAIRRRRA
ncbi:MAG TPA: hypothetical protein VGL86_11315 [Polyangia bacterium]|jgi:hypothetical protein